jgi:hypothetical protein
VLNTGRPPILRPAYFLLNEEEHSLISTRRPKLGWPDRKVTFGKCILSVQLHLKNSSEAEKFPSEVLHEAT